MAEELRYVVHPRARAEAVLARFRDGFDTRTPRDGVTERVYLDTFDWRLCRAGLRLVASADPRGTRMSLENGTRSEGRHAVLASLPRQADDLPPGTGWERAARLVGERALLPRVALTERRRTLDVLDGEEKTVARVSLEEASARPSEGPGGPRELPLHLRLAPIRGYEEAARRLAAFAREELGLDALPEDDLPLALAALGLDARDPSKPRIALDPTQRADEATRAIQRALLATLLANEAGAREHVDPEFLHDFRVAIRRIRTALACVEPVLPGAAVEHFRGEFRWLGQVTGPARDLDVFLAGFDRLASRLPTESRAALEPLRAHLQVRREGARRAVSEALAGARWQALAGTWRAFLERPFDGDAAPPDADLTAVELAARRVHAAWRRVCKRGRKLGHPPAADELHALRIHCKKLRYLLEFFTSLYDTSEIAALVAPLKRVQDALGKVNDDRVQSGDLERFALEMAERDRPPVGTLLAIGRLQQLLAARAPRDRRRALESFERFRDRTAQRFEHLFSSGGDEG